MLVVEALRAYGQGVSLRLGDAAESCRVGTAGYVGAGVGVLVIVWLMSCHNVLQKANFCIIIASNYGIRAFTVMPSVLVAGYSRGVSGPFQVGFH